ncbi:beta-galactosidase [Parablautia muri]|uniref:Beta-galactosidase n=1 Tax=Parablautia muri TaxID=2320879 RepID=A0A9X5BHK0_9FIRM|nr:beta-galactosidase [Parablautia muri]NBJ93906.1 beta-galactosidase [Parablautia muri]
MGKKVNFGKLLHGGDYNPEQWLESPEILDKDIAYFKKAKINEVSLGIFSWSVLEPEEGKFHFEWMEEIIDRLYENGISTILATPSGARPKWMADKYPEVLRMDETRRRMLYGTRHNHCYTSPVYREKTRIMNQELARRFGPHPGVIAWHISNEYGGECHCPLCQEEFRKWIQNRYQTVERLNHAWATTFWSHKYNRFDQVESPSSIGEPGLHGLNLDWRRFVTDRTLDFIRHEIAAIRNGGSDKPTTINMMYDFRELNYHKLADVIDFVSWDNYPQWHKKEEILTARDSGMQHDIMRSLRKEPFFLMESCPSATNWQPVSKLKKPGMLHAASMQAVAHGSDSVLYFQLRQSQGSSEKFHGAVIDHYGGEDTRVFGEVSQVGESLRRLGEVAGTMPKAKVAVLFDWESRWAMEDAQGPRNDGLFYKESVLKSYHAFRNLGLDVDMIDMEQPLEDYKIVAAPMLYMFRAGFEEKARRFVSEGGKFILTYWSGIVDETDLCFLEGTPHGLMDVMGLRSTEIDGLYDGEVNSGVPVEGNTLHMAHTYACSHLCDLVRLSTAEAVLVYGSDFYKGMPALTKNNFGEGQAYYICADFDQDFYDDFYGKIVKEARIELPVEKIPAGVEVTRRSSKDAEYLFVQNFNREPVNMDLPIGEYQILLGDYNGTVARFGTVVLKKKL